MREVQLASFHCFQLELPGRTNKRHGHNQPRATSSAHSLFHGSRESLRSRSSNSFSKSISNHKCVAVDDTIKSKDSQQILIGSALRRPHATSYSPLDYQIMPDVGKAPKQPYRSQSAGTVYRYASRPLSAVHAGTLHGKQTKSSLLRNKSISCDSIASKTSSSFHTPSRPSSGNKRLCEIHFHFMERQFTVF
ncbi:uncharacterized protein LOC114574203 isoform X2 [Exaiptasia diaphana]|uniref:Uncharacterized protein n=1 Tax=Exaiptasia diaphana TaxID=2652724 RepID=A0A913Y2P4_EXADI|nr:uncharacterized protein LOC114574203 isoform X2 [Exaiptasia diaphana]